MGEHETREVRTEFTAEDHGVQGLLAKFSSAFTHAHHQTEGLRDKIRDFRKEQGLTLVATLGLGYGIGSVFERIKEENAEFGRAKKGIAGVLAGSLKFDKETSEIDRYRRSLKLANDITDEVDETSARFGMSLESVSDIYKKTAVSIGGLGLSQKQVSEAMVNIAGNATRFGISGEQAVDTVSRALRTGTVRGVDPFSSALSHATMNMKKLTQEQRFERIDKFLRTGTQIADEMNNGIGGALAKIRNVVGDTLRDLTSPIFGDIARKMQAWAKHLKETRENGKTLVEDVGGKLLTAFQTISGVVGKIRENWASIAAVTAGMKLASVAGNLAERAAQLRETAGDAAGGLGGRIMGGAAGALGKVASLTIMAGTAYLVGSAIGDLVSGRMQAAQDNKARATDMVAKLSNLAAVTKAAGGGPLMEGQEATARKAIAALEKMGVVAADNAGRYAVNLEKLKSAYHEGQYDQSDAMLLKKYFGAGDKVMADKLPEAIANTVNPLLSTINARMDVTKGDVNRKFAKQVVNNNFTGGIHVTWKNEETDPDRVFVRFVDHLENYTSRRTQAVTADPLSE